MDANMRSLVLINFILCLFGHRVLGRYDDLDNYRIEPVVAGPRTRIVRPILLWKRSRNSDDLNSFWKREVNRDKLIGFQKALQFGKRSRIKPYESNDY